VLDLSKAPPRALPEDLLKLAEAYKGRADDCGRLARAVLAALAVRGEPVAWHNPRADRDARGMLVARLENMQAQGDTWLTVQAVLALLNDCDALTLDAMSEPAVLAAAQERK
jgi:hypothetical protein